jgi:uncharacterized protein with PIN domain
LQAREPLKQTEEVLAAFHLQPGRELLFTRCIRCNRQVRQVKKEAVAHRLPAIAYKLYDQFTYCRSCDKLYWRGEQYRRLLAVVEAVVGS